MLHQSNSEDFFCYETHASEEFVQELDSLVTGERQLIHIKVDFFFSRQFVMEPTMQHTFYFKRKGYSTLHTHGHPNIRELVHGERMETGQQRRRKDAEREGSTPGLEGKMDILHHLLACCLVRCVSTKRC